MANLRVFISYAWESDEYRERVAAFATRLRQNGIDARLDSWHLEAGASIAQFMNSEVRKADKVLVLCSPEYRRKVHLTEDGERVTGSGWEAGLLADQVFANLAGKRKAIPILFRGLWQEAAPDFMIGQVYLDLSNDSSFEDQYKQLLRQITGRTTEAPALGELPSGLYVTPPEALKGTSAEEDEAKPADVTVRFTIDDKGETPQVELRVDDREPLRAPFELDLADSQTGREVETIAANECTLDDIQNLGSELWSKLLAGDLATAVSDAKHASQEREGVLQIRLEFPSLLEGLPWEGLYDFDSLVSELAANPLTSIVRGPYGRPPKPKSRSQEGGPLRMLVVIPSGSGLDTGTEWEKIQQSIRAAGDKVELECLESPVTADKLRQALNADWDIVHFIGHGKLDDRGQVTLRLNGESNEDNWLPAQQLAQMFIRSSVQLVVLNCCQTGAVGTEVKSLNTPGSLGAFLMKARIPAVIVMRYEIPDNVSADFSRTFYHELLQGARAGRVDLAVQEGRATLLRTFVDDQRVRSYITPVLYLATGREQLFDLATNGTKKAAAEAGGEIDERIDKKLLYALTSGRCLPILGSGILSADAMRSDALAPDPSNLARKLGEASEFPDFERLISVVESSSEWMSPMLLERICQHFSCTHPGERAALTDAIQKAYRDFDPPQLVDRIARWPAAGMVYANVDGLLERALVTHRGRNLRVIQPESLGGAPAADELVLLNLRGNYTSPQTMVLTESDEDQVLDNIGEIASFVEDLMNGVGSCTLLFMGVSPRDPLVRALSRRLLRHDVSRSRGTAFFAAASSTPADRAYWEEFAKLEWLEIDDQTLIQGLSIAAAQAEKEAS